MPPDNKHIVQTQISIHTYIVQECELEKKEYKRRIKNVQNRLFGAKKVPENSVSGLTYARPNY